MLTKEKLNEIINSSFKKPGVLLGQPDIIVKKEETLNDKFQQFVVPVPFFKIELKDVKNFKNFIDNKVMTDGEVITEDSIKKVKINVPLLTIVPISTIKIEDVDKIKFNSEIENNIYEDLTKEYEKSGINCEINIPGLFIPREIKLSEIK